MDVLKKTFKYCGVCVRRGHRLYREMKDGVEDRSALHSLDEIQKIKQRGSFGKKIDVLVIDKEDLIKL